MAAHGRFRRGGLGLSGAQRFDPRRLDVAAFAQAGALLQGDWPAQALRRLQQGALPWPGGDAPAVVWTLQGESRAVAGAEPEIRLHLQARTSLQLSCQRCLQPMEVPLAVDTRLRFVRDEALAEQLDGQSDEDVLALPPRLDLRELVEDELILALPLVPRHARCPRPLPMSAGEEALDAEAPAAQGLAGLAALLGRAGPGGKPN
jgi:uncharacterized protein